MDALGFGAETGVAARCLRPCEIADSVPARFGVGKQVEPVIAPGVARQNRGGGEADIIVERCPARIEYRIENRALGKDGRARVDCGAADDILSHFTTRMPCRFDDSHVIPLRCQQSRAGQAADPGTDDDCPWLGHAHSTPACRM